jgi:NADH-quinone oxidoreductase subunit M
MAVAFLFMGFASVGLPLTLGFVAEDLLVQGSVEELPALGLALIVATALNGVSVMRAFFTLFSGSSKHIGECDLTPRESGVLTVVMATLLLTGIFPGFTVRGLERLTEGQEASPSLADASFNAQNAPLQHQRKASDDRM